MQQVKSPGDAHQALSVAFPVLTMENQFGLRDNSQLPIPHSAAAEKHKHTILPRRPQMPRSEREGPVCCFAAVRQYIRARQITRGGAAWFSSSLACSHVLSTSA